MSRSGYYGRYVGGLAGHSASQPASLRLTDEGVDLIIFRGLAAERERFLWDAVRGVDVAAHATVTSTRFGSARLGRLAPRARMERRRLRRTNTTVTLRLRSGERARLEFQHVDPARIAAVVRESRAAGDPAAG